MNNPLQQTIEALAKEKGIEPDMIILAIEDAVLTASRKYYKTNENLKTRFNPETGQVDLFAIKHIVTDVTSPATEISLQEAQELYGQEAEVDMEIEFPKRTDVLGRIAAQTAKQVIFQKVREAERENIFAEFNDRVGEVVSGTVKRFENGDLVLEIGRIEAVLPRREQSRAESYSPGEPGAGHRRRGVLDRLLPVALSRRRVHRRRGRRRARLRPDSSTGSRAIILSSKPRSRTEWACAHFFSLRGTSGRHRAGASGGGPSGERVRAGDLRRSAPP